MPLQKLIGNIYSVIVEISLWLMPIAGAVGGAIFMEEEMGNGFLGFILGLLAGIIFDVMCVGPLIILMNIRASLKNIEKEQNISPNNLFTAGGTSLGINSSNVPHDNRSSSGGTSSGNEGIKQQTITKDDSNVEKKRCRKCNALVPADVFKCLRCGGKDFI